MHFCYRFVNLFLSMTNKLHQSRAVLMPIIMILFPHFTRTALAKRFVTPKWFHFNRNILMMLKTKVEKLNSFGKENPDFMLAACISPLNFITLGNG